MSKRTKITALKISLTACFAAACCICTMISVPLPIGYFNLGDMLSLVSGWFLGPVFGALAAGIGGAITDLILGFGVYAPATFVIKAALAVTAFYLYKATKKLISSKRTDPIPRVISAIVAELIMVGGYFIYEYAILGYGMGAAASVIGNTIQAAAGVAGGVVIATFINSSSRVLSFFNNKEEIKK